MAFGKTNETLVRKWSKTQKLYIICGGYFTSKKMKGVSVPDYCWKVVQNVKQKRFYFVVGLRTAQKATVEEITVAELEKKLKSKIILIK